MGFLDRLWKKRHGSSKDRDSKSDVVPSPGQEGATESASSASAISPSPLQDSAESKSSEPIPSQQAPPTATDASKELKKDDISEGLKVLVDKPADDAGCVDIIAVHGLGGDLVETWTDKGTGLNWLSDARFLAKDLSQARIMTYGYDSTRYFSRSEADVRDFASEFLATIKSNRRGKAERNRPLVFVCHSLGGLVFKQVCTYGILARRNTDTPLGCRPRPRAE